MRYAEQAYIDGWNDGYYQRGKDGLRAEHDPNYEHGYEGGERDRTLSFNQSPPLERCPHCDIPKVEHLMPLACKLDWQFAQGAVIPS